MLYITTIPDDYYFTWQLELQLYNFGKLGIPKENIHVLIGYNADQGLRLYFSELIDKLTDKALFFAYADLRKEKKYSPSIRPYLLQQHIKAYPYIETANIFYYDTDIILREPLTIEKLTKGNSWYVSDTRNYLDSQYIKNSGGNELFTEMCKTVGISQSFVEENDNNCGGAQYVIKKAPLLFWEKVEKDCEALYDLMRNHNHNKAEQRYIESGERRNKLPGEIQAWCAEMWAILWNAWLFNYQVRINDELNFCWPTESIQNWQSTKILHYSGLTKKDDLRYFRKGNYLKFSPHYDDNLKYVDKECCSFPLIKLIEEYKQSLDKERVDTSDITLIYNINEENANQIKNFIYNIKYLNKHLIVNIIIHEDCKSNITEFGFPVYSNIRIIKQNDQSLNSLIQEITTPFIGICDISSIIPVNQFFLAVQNLREGNSTVISPFDQIPLKVDSLFTEMFSKILDDSLLLFNSNKFFLKKDPINNILFLKKEVYFYLEDKLEVKKINNYPNIEGKLYVLFTLNDQ